MKEEEPVYFLPFNYADFPKRIRLITSTLVENPPREKIYVERVEAYIEVYMLDDDFTIGHCECTNCRKTIDPFDKYCPRCGAKIKGRRDAPKKAKTGVKTDKSTVYVSAEDGSFKPIFQSENGEIEQ